MSRWVGSYSPNFADLIEFRVILVRNAAVLCQDVDCDCSDRVLLLVCIVVASNSEAEGFPTIACRENETSEDTSDHPIHRYNAKYSSECKDKSGAARTVAAEVEQSGKEVGCSRICEFLVWGDLQRTDSNYWSHCADIQSRGSTETEILDIVCI